MAWGKNGTPSTLTGVADVITISDLTATKFNVNLSHVLQSGLLNTIHRLGNTTIDSSTNYSTRYSENGGADATATSTTYMTDDQSNDAFDQFFVGYFLNISSQEKLCIGFWIKAGTAGAGNAPQRTEVVGKWVNTSVQFDNIRIFNTNSGDMAIGSNLSALGTD